MAGSEGGSDELALRLLATSDLHAYLAAYDYHADRVQEGTGLTRIAALIRQARREVPTCLLFDNGDALQGTALADYIAEERGLDDKPHPVIAAMNALGYDAATLGNHEFDYGLDFLERSLLAARYPVVLANVVRRRGAHPSRDIPFRPPHVLLWRQVPDSLGRTHRLGIGVIGVAPPQIAQWNRGHVAGRLEFRDSVEAVAAHLPALRAAGADLIVVLSHGGFGGAAHAPGAENATAAIAALDGVDAVIAGHVHQCFPADNSAEHPAADAAAGTVHGKPAVMPGQLGSHLGVIDLRLARAEGRWRVTGASAALRPTGCRTEQGRMRATVGDDPATLALIAEAHEATRAYTARPVGRGDRPLDTYFSAIGHDTATRAVAAVQARIVSRELSGTGSADLPVLSAAAPFKSGGRGGPDQFTDIPAGPLSLCDIAQLYPFPNTLQAVVLTGQDLRAWLEHAVRGYRRVAPGAQDAPLLDETVPGYMMDIVTGVDYRIDLAIPPGEGRIRDLAIGGVPVAPRDRVIVATNSYRAAGGGGFPVPDPGCVLLDSPRTLRDLLIEEIGAHGLPSMHRTADRAFAPMPGTTVTFSSGAGAVSRLLREPIDGVTSLGPAGDGSHRFRMAL